MLQGHLILIKEDDWGPVYADPKSIVQARRLIKEQSHLNEEGFELQSVTGSRFTLTLREWEMIKPFLIRESMTENQDDRAAVLKRELETARQRILDLEQALAGQAAPVTNPLVLEGALLSDPGEISPDSPQPIPTIPLHRVIRVKCISFYSKTSSSQRPMWSGFTDEGVTVNIFDHTDPLRDHKPLLERAGYLSVFQAMKEGETLSWQTTPILIAMKQSGKFWDLVNMSPRKIDDRPDEPAEELTPEQLAVCREAKALLERPDLIVFDCETTGLGSDDEVVEISAVNAKQVSVLTTLIKPMELMNLRRPGKNGKCSVDIHGLDEQTLASAPHLSDPSTQQMIETALGGKVWAAFNIAFDVRLLTQSWTIANAAAPFPMASDTVCVQRLMNRYLGHDYTSVDESCRVLKIERQITHRAAGDARDTLMILQALAVKVPADDLPF